MRKVTYWAILTAMTITGCGDGKPSKADLERQEMELRLQTMKRMEKEAVEDRAHQAEVDRLTKQDMEDYKVAIEALTARGDVLKAARKAEVEQIQGEFAELEKQFDVVTAEFEAIDFPKQTELDKYKVDTDSLTEKLDDCAKRIGDADRKLEAALEDLWDQRPTRPEPRF